MYRLLTLCFLLLTAPVRAGDNPDWRAPLAPFQISDNLYDVTSASFFLQPTGMRLTSRAMSKACGMRLRFMEWAPGETSDAFDKVSDQTCKERNYCASCAEGLYLKGRAF
jgi:hypothetical protein